MIFIILILMIIIIVLITYLFFVKADLRRIRTNLVMLKESDSNHLIHSELSLKELNELISEINDLLKNSKNKKVEFERKSLTLKKMMTNISHDLRTPLTSALGYIDIILNSNLTKEEKVHNLNMIEERLKRLEELINSFFEFSKMISNSQSPNLEEVNVIAILEESIARFYEDFHNNNRKILFHSSFRKVKMNSNEELLTRVFDNLIGNAFKHSQGNLIIKVEKQKTLKILFINELFVDNLDIDHIFDEFYTVDISRVKGNTGLGLAIAKEFIVNLSGKIYAKIDKKRLQIVIEWDKM